MSPAPLLALFALGVWGVARVGVSAVRRWAARRHLLDYPTARSSHLQPTPLGGGLAIVLPVLLGWWGWALVAGFAGGGLGWTAGALLVAAVGWADDLRPIPPLARLLVQALAAAIAAAAIHPAGVWIIAVPVWIVALTNIFNFMDGLDGLAGLQGVVAGLGWALLGWIGQTPEVMAAGLIVAAACLGLLGENWTPARIFMGDVGSTFLGFSFAVLPLWNWSDPADVPTPAGHLVLGALVLWPFIFDASVTILRRVKGGEALLQSHRSHLYQRLAAAGWSHGRVARRYAMLSGVGIACAVLAQAAPEVGAWLAPGAMLLIGATLWTSARGAEARRAARS